MTPDDFTPDYSENVSDDPIRWGLKIVAAISQPNLSYEFDEYIVWADRDGLLYYAQDSGCSCPTPFEGYKSIADLQRVGNGNYALFAAEIRKWYDGPATSANAFLRKVGQAIDDPPSVRLTDEDIAAWLQAKAQEKFRADVMEGMQRCRTQLREVFPDIRSWGSSKLTDTVVSLEAEPIGDVLVLGVYLTRMAERIIEQSAAKAEAANAPA